MVWVLSLIVSRIGTRKGRKITISDKPLNLIDIITGNTISVLLPLQTEVSFILSIVLVNILIYRYINSILPHHYSSDVALVGGGTFPQPGEISLGHNGVLFLDELPEFKRTVLEVMRQPLEDMVITISMAKSTVDYPASFMKEAIEDPETEVIIVALPDNLHKEAILMACNAGKHVLCTKPLALNASEAKEILNAVEKAGVFHGYLEDLVYTPKTLKEIEMVKNGSCGRILCTRSREAHSGPHSAWFWDKKQSGGGALVDMGCHCIEIGRSLIGKEIKPIEVMCRAETQVKPIEAEDHALGYPDMFTDMLDSPDQNKAPRETFYDGYVVNAIMDACYKSVKTKKWEPVELIDWRGKEGISSNVDQVDFDEHHYLIKREKMAGGKTKLVLKEKSTGNIIQKVISG